MSRQDDLEFCRIIGKGFSVEQKPFTKWSDETGVPLPQLFARLEDLKSRGWIRRVAVSVRHRDVGYKHNSMIIIRTEEHKLDDIGRKLALLDAVSHCYQRSHPDGYPWCLYVMIHAYTEAEIEQTIQKVVEQAGAEKFEVLRSVREFKKTTFVPSRWEDRE
jgi:DNA-binding Lrp family transcriptional regulator